MAFLSKEVTLASLNSHIPPLFETSTSLPVQYYTADLRRSSRLSRGPWVSVPQLVSCAFLVVVLIIQFIIPSHVNLGTVFRDSLRSGIRLESPAICHNTPVFLEPLPTSRPYKMSLLEEARQVAAEFDYTAQDVNKGVKEFIRQMGRLMLFTRREALCANGLV